MDGPRFRACRARSFHRVSQSDGGSGAGTQRPSGGRGFSSPRRGSPRGDRRAAPRRSPGAGSGPVRHARAMRPPGENAALRGRPDRGRRAPRRRGSARPESPRVRTGFQAPRARRGRRSTSAGARWRAVAQRQNEKFIVWVTKERPFVLAKWASTLDGKIAAADGRSQWYHRGPRLGGGRFFSEMSTMPFSSARERSPPTIPVSRGASERAKGRTSASSSTEDSRCRDARVSFTGGAT